MKSEKKANCNKKSRSIDDGGSSSDNSDNKTDEVSENMLNEKNISSSVFTLNTTVNIISLLIAAISIFFVFFIYADECRKCLNDIKILQSNQRQPPIVDTTNKKRFWAYGHNIKSGYLQHVFNVFNRLGYSYLGENVTHGENWDVLWAHDYPFRALYPQLRNLREHQRVNHFPGCGYVTNKVDLATSKLKYIPPAFRLPENRDDFLEYARLHPEKKYVTKHNEHRHVKVKSLDEIDLNSNGSFVQVFVDNPLLVDGHMFDIGIYTIITSIDPLRVYIYHGDFLLRFCPEQYHPFDPNNLDKYIVGDDYLPTWEIPGLKHYYNNLGFGMRDSLSAYLKEQGKDAEVIWKQIDDSIRTVLLNKEPLIAGTLGRFKSKRNFFEMMRFDFIVDENLNLYLLEANMSPNLSSAHFKPNQLLYEQVIFNMLGLVGVGERLGRGSLSFRSEAEEKMQTADKNIAVTPHFCATECSASCDLVECDLCKPCIDADFRKDLVLAHREHLNRGDCKRVFPPQMVPGDATIPENLSDKNMLMYRWFQSKCDIDRTWC